MKIFRILIAFISVSLLTTNSNAQELKDISRRNTIKNRFSIYLGIGTSKEEYTQSGKNLSYQFGLAKKIKISKVVDLNNEISINRFPFVYNSINGNYNNNYYYINISAVPEIKISDSIHLGVAPSINYFFSPSNPYFKLFDESKIISIGGNSYIGINLDDILLKFRYNFNTIDTKRIGPFIGLNIEYNIKL